tara:strand:- start:2258 stop:2488 length:231 start_codon:yes stop_codon:yes gene_type:complete
MPQSKQLNLMWRRATSRSYQTSRNSISNSTYSTERPQQKIYYNAGNPNLSYSNNAYSISISQPSGNNMITGVGWLD